MKIRHIRAALAASAGAAVLAALGLATAPAAAAQPGGAAAGAGHPAIKGITLHPAAAVAHGRPAITTTWRNRRPARRDVPLLYHGGPVQQDPELYVLFWGSWWASGCTNTQNNGSGDESYLYNFYHGLAGASDLESPITSQYFGPSGNYPLFPVVAGQAFITWNADCNDPPASATDAQLAAEAVSYANSLASAGYTINNNTQIVVVSPSGTNPGGGFGSQYCAYHNWAQYSSSQLISWTNLPYMPDQGGNCGANFVQNGSDGWSIVGGHEYNEAVTDPFVNNQSAWYDGNGEEIGDKCAWTGLFLQNLSTGAFAAQPEYSNAAGGCAAAFSYLNGKVHSVSHTTLCLSAATTAGSGLTLGACGSGGSARKFVKFPDGSLRRWQNTAACLTAGGSGSQVLVQRCAEVGNQVWSYSGTTKRWTNGTGLCLKAPSQVSGAAVIVSGCSTVGTEKFTNV